MSGMKFVWFDIGSHMGWAHNCRGGIDYGTFDFSTEVNRPARLWRTFETLDGFLRGLMVDAVGFERPFARGRAATRSLWGQAGIVEAVATRRGFAVLDEEPNSIKKFATGNGKADKPMMVVAAKRFLWPNSEQNGFNVVVVNEHEADAICGLQYLLSQAKWSTK